MRVMNVLPLVLGLALSAQALAAKPEIRPLPSQNRCVAMLPSSVPAVILMVVKDKSSGLQVMMFSSVFDQLKGKEVGGEISWSKAETINGSFTFNGPAVTLPMEKKEFFAKTAQGKTLTVKLSEPAGQTIKFDLRDAKSINKDLDECLSKF
ncbi:hypothetical protein [Enterobacillus tribolii]|uniref:Uncharacterized protein n=1 Tax=Enterobacillus tribolii TaxID=1487935 RepID=A0A370QLY5_9GAMM|nr:hypothetical protein [Enterobacillus tribolii]MBW7982207.1 hypothetical protein [Enterobacillus tribolii]RDK89376.1 hypothetical protein C8D90_10727 [Enterobacillus tribolii]